MAAEHYLVLITGQKSLSKSFSTLLAPAVKTLTFRSGYKKDAIHTISEIFADYGIAITSDAIERILMTVGRDMRYVERIADGTSGRQDEPPVADQGAAPGRCRSRSVKMGLGARLRPVRIGTSSQIMCLTSELWRLRSRSTRHKGPS